MRSPRRSAAPVMLLAAAVLVIAGCGFAASRDQSMANAAGELGPAAFVNVTVLPLDRNETLPAQTVVVRDGRIVALGPADRVEVPGDARRIPGTGKFLMPGLVDAHFHLQSHDDDDRRLLRLLVANGVTSILNLYGSPAILLLRQRVADGAIVGPTIYTSGPYISDAPNWQPEADEVERLVVQQHGEGYDLIKTHGDFSLDAFHRLCVVAHREHMKVIGHAPRNLGVEPMFEEHMDAVAHGEEFIYAYFFFGAPDLSQSDPEVRRRFLEQAETRIPTLAAATAKAGTWVVPNLVAYTMIVDQGKDLAAVLARPEVKYLPPRLAAQWQPGQNRYDRKYSPQMAEHMMWRVRLLSTLTGAFGKAGVPMMAGSDAPIPGVLPGFSIHDELKLLVAAGLTPYEALRTATANPARFLERSGEFGTVAIGRRADLLLLDANPLDNVANAAKPAGVMVRGKWIAADQLRAFLTD